MSLLIEGALLDGAACSIRIQGGRIVSVEPGPDASRVPAPPQPSPAAGEGSGERVLDARGLYAFPAFRNGHTHAPMVLLRGYGDDMDLMEWLRTRIWPAERHLTEEDVYLGTRLGILEMIKGGTTFFNEMYWHRPGIVRAVEEMGVRALVGVTVIDLGDPEVLARQKDEVETLVAEHRAARRSRPAGTAPGAGGGPDSEGGGGPGSEGGDGPGSEGGDGPDSEAGDGPDSEAGDGPDSAAGGVAELALAPHSIYTVSPDTLAWVGELAREAELPVHLHLSETAGEVEACVRAHGCRPAQLLDRLGLLGPRLIAAHGQFLDDDELALLGEAGATIVTNPTANLKLATGGILPYRAARRAGVRVCLGTDGAASNNNLDMIEEMKIAALVQKHRERDATALPAAEALAMATTSPSAAFRLGSGRVEPGALADLVLVDFSGPSTQPLHDPVSTLVYAASAANVRTTICAGRVLMHAGRVEVCDEREVTLSAARAAGELLERARDGRI